MSLVSTVPPYHSQWESPELIEDFLAGRRASRTDPHWARSGARTPEEYEFWSIRVCGMAGLRSVLSLRDGASPGTVTLAHEVLSAGGYTMRPGGVRGLVYAPFARYLSERWGISAEVVPELSPAALVEQVRSGALVFASVHGSIRHAQNSEHLELARHPEPPPRGGHLVLAYAVTDVAVTDDARTMPRRTMPPERRAASRSTIRQVSDQRPRLRSGCR